MKLKKIKSTFILFILCFIVFNIYLSLSIVKATSEKDEIIRLHVVANSNTVEDQLIKLKVSSKIEEFINSLNLENKNSKDTLNILNDNIENISEIVNNKLKEENAPYSCTVNIGKIYYDEIKENTLTRMDTGLYNSLKITLGNGNGKNFWSFISPNKENLEKLKDYENILPGITNLYKNFETLETDESTLNETKKATYKSKILELLNINL